MASVRTPGLQVRGLSFAYASRPVLSAVDLDVDPGEIVGVLGPNGSGKSTLIKVLSGVLGDYRGSVRVAGNEVRDSPQRELARCMAVVPQESRFAFPFTALEIVLMGRHPHLGGLKFESARDLELARQALDRCGATELAGRTVQQLSSGERQRIVFARALAQEPRTLLLDEPASFLDIRHQVELYDLVRQLAHDSNTAVLTVLHDINLAAEYCDRVYLLRRGQVEASGPTAQALSYGNLTRVFETEVYIDTNALTGRLLVTPLPGRIRDKMKGNHSGGTS